VTEGTIDATTISGFVQRFSTTAFDGESGPPGDKAEEPLVVGSRVYGLGWDGAFRAWSTTAGANASPVATTVALNVGEKYVGTPSYAGTPADGTLYAMTNRGRLVALDGTSLTQDWSLPLSTVDEPYELSPLVVGGVVVVPADREVVAVDRTTGLRAWTTPMTNGTRGSAAADGTRAFVFDECDLVALRLTDGAELWRSDLVPGDQTCSRGLSGPERMAPVVDAGVVFTSAYSAGGTVAIDAATGAVQWRTMTLGWRSTPVVTERYVVTDRYGSALSLLDRFTGELVGAASFDEVDNVRGTWTVVGDLAVFRNSGRIQAVDLLSLETVWRSPILEQNISYGGTAVHGGRLYTYTADGRVVAFGPAG
jgi:outer membrane protein assembly factor BamB